MGPTKEERKESAKERRDETRNILGGGRQKENHICLPSTHLPRFLAQGLHNWSQLRIFYQTAQTNQSNIEISGGTDRKSKVSLRILVKSDSNWSQKLTSQDLLWNKTTNSQLKSTNTFCYQPRLKHKINERKRISVLTERQSDCNWELWLSVSLSAWMFCGLLEEQMRFSRKILIFFSCVQKRLQLAF